MTREPTPREGGRELGLDGPRPAGLAQSRAQFPPPLPSRRSGYL
jgi:hypothetical protein